MIDKYKKDDVEITVQQEIDEVEMVTTATDVPIAILLAGQPGAGKTQLSTMMVSLYKNNVVFINGDEYRRYHPNYRDIYSLYGIDSVSYTSKFSSDVTETLIDRVSDLKRNLIIEGTGRTTEVPIKTAKKLIAKGYKVEMSVLAVKPELSLMSILNRFYEMCLQGTIPRATATTAHDTVVNKLPENLDYLFDREEISKIKLWNRELELLYDSSVVHEYPSKALYLEWDRSWTESEEKGLLIQLGELYAKEKELNLGQENVIQELERRIKKSISSDK